ncbi:MAG: hypothetical protein ABIP75_15375 [Pyrinomonadaceae bacterium]
MRDFANFMNWKVYGNIDRIDWHPYYDLAGLDLVLCDVSSTGTTGC